MDLSVLIPSRNEMFLKNTVEDILAHAKAQTEVIVVLDGAWADPPLEKHERVQIIYLRESIGQRAATNLAARVSKARYIFKADAHCSFDDGFDAKLIDAGEELGHDVTQIPRMYNLRAFTWLCEGCGKETYQGPEPTACSACGSRGTAGGPFKRLIKWDRLAGGMPGKHVRSDYWGVDESLKFHYWPEYGKRPEAQGDIVDVMSNIGALFFMRRERFLELGGFDEAHGSWGAAGCEIALKSWLSGGRHMVNKKTWAAHLFRTQGAGFSFPYPLSGAQVDRAKAYSRDLWWGNKFDKQVRPLSWLVDHFHPAKGWSEDAIARVRSAGAEFAASRQQNGSALRTDVGAPSPLTVGLAGSADATGIGVREEPSRLEEVSSLAVGLSPVDGRYGVGTGQVVLLHDQHEVGGITAPLVVADDVVKDGDSSGVTPGHGFDQPGIDQSVNAECLVVADGPAKTNKADLSIPVFVETADPIPASGLTIDANLCEQARDGLSVEVGDSKIFSSQSSASTDVRLGPAGSSQLSVGSPSILTPIMGIAHVSGRLAGASNDRAGDDAACVGGDESRTGGPDAGDGGGVHERDIAGAGVQGDMPARGGSAGGSSKGCIYYSDVRPDPVILDACRRQLVYAAMGLPIVSVSLKPVDLGFNVVLPAERGPLTMARQILIALKLSTAAVVYFCEHDVLYHHTHFLFTPEPGVFSYNQNCWKLNSDTGDALFYYANQLSGMCVYRDTAIEHFEKRVAIIERDGFSRRLGFEPATRKVRHGGVDDSEYATWMSEMPIVDIRHHHNLTPNRFTKSAFRNQKYTEGWTEAGEIPGWGQTKGRFAEWLLEVTTHG